jgi:anti-anti-sigma factor
MDPGTALLPSLTLSARTAGGTTVAELGGELDIACAPALRDQLLGLLRRGSSRLVIDLSKVTYCDASGLAVLVGTGRRAKLLGGSLRLAAVSPQMDEVLNITGLRRHLDFFPTVRAATYTPDDAPHVRTDPPARDRAPGAVRGQASPRTRRPWTLADFSELREVASALLAHDEAWRVADPGRRFAHALRAMARACDGSDDTVLETAARSLLSVLARHPLSHSQAVAASATRLRRVLDSGCQPALA